MTVLCDVQGCAYWYQGMCANKALLIDRNGTCNELRYKRAGSHIDDEFKDKPNVLNIVKHEG